MSQTSDIVLDGIPYMLVPGSYRRGSAGPPEGRSGRITINDFVGGQHRALQLERDTSWDSSGVGPAFFGQGVEPWPWSGPHTDSVLSQVTASQRVYSQPLGSAIYLGTGRFVYRTVALSAGSWADLTQVADLGVGNIITGLTQYNGYLAIACGTGRDIQLLDPGTLVLTTLAAGLNGAWIVSYASRLVIADPLPGNENIVRLTTGAGIDNRELDTPIVNMALHGGKVAIATRSALWLLGGRSDPIQGVWLGEPEPVYTQLGAAEDDFRFLCSFGGKLYTWLSGNVVEWNPNGGASKQGWRAVGLDGRFCFGGTVAGNMLVVSMQHRTGVCQLWAFDGTGWWLIKESESTTWVWPVALSGAGMRDLLVFRDGDTGVIYDTVRMIPHTSSAPSYAAAGNFTTSLLDAGERDSFKCWQSIGAVFATPEARGNPVSTDPVTLALDWSVDGGTNWTTAATIAVSDPSERVHELAAVLPTASTIARFLQLRVAFASVTDWSPVLTGLWADYLLLDSTPRRRRWSCAVQARDGSIQRDGSVAGFDGRAQSAALWQSWEMGDTVTFRDIDYDANPVERRTRIVAIEEQIAKPSDAGQWGTATLQLQLLEV